MRDVDAEVMAELDEPEATTAVEEKPTVVEDRPQPEVKPHQTANLPEKRTEKVPIVAGSQGATFSTFEDMFRFARAVVISGLAPKGMNKAETVLVAMQAGMEVGFPPMAAIQNVNVINGRPSLGGDAALAVVRNSGELESYEETEDGENDGHGWTITVKRKGQTAISRTFTISDAKRARLWGKSGPWTEYPNRMLRYRALGFVLRDTFSDVLKGLHITEEFMGARDISAEVEVSDPRAKAFTE